MIGILIVTHGSLGDSLIHCANHVLGGPQPFLEEMSVTIQDDPGEVFPRIRDKAKTLDQGDGVLILTDIYGATPSNIACRLMNPGKVEGIAGVNLPMLIRALTYRNEPLEAATAKALSGGCGGIVHITSDACHAEPGS